MILYKNNKIIAITLIDNPIFGPIVHVTTWAKDVQPSKGICPSNGIVDWTFLLHIILIE